MKQRIEWCKEHIHRILLLFLIAFIPLYPKLPLLDIKYTWVYIRIEDLLVTGVYALFIVSRFRRPAAFRTPLTIPIAVYWLVGFISLIHSLAFIGPKIDHFFPFLGILHFLRRIEYMGLFFVAYDTFRDRRYRRFGVLVIILTVLAVIVYGYGQKFYGWPAFLTMNEEFAKGVPLRLPPTARIASTFGGHYDLAAYLVLTLPILVTLVFSSTAWVLRLTALAVFVGGYTVLLFTASRISFGVYLVSTSSALWMMRKRWAIPILIITSVWCMQYVSGAQERFVKTLRFSDVIVDLSTGRPVGTLEKLEGTTAVVEEQESPATESLPKGTGYIGVQSPPSAPAKIVKTLEHFSSTALSTGSGEISTASGSFLIQKAFVYDISITTRFQGQWPKAMEAFGRNVFLGSGYSTLSIASDSDYMRMLGETGVLGSLAFLGIFVSAFSYYRLRNSALLGMDRALTVGVYGGLVGLLLNAVLIDVFEASKVAYTFWAYLGMATAILAGKDQGLHSYQKVMRSLIGHRYTVYGGILILVFILYRQALAHYFLGDDFTWLKWAADTYLTEVPGYISDAKGFFFRPIPKLWYYGMYSVFWLKPTAYHIASLVLFGLAGIILYSIMKRLGVRSWLAMIGTIFFVSQSIHHENVFWVSGQSSLLAAMFAAMAIGYAIPGAPSNRSVAYFRYIMLLFTCIAAMLSYDGLAVLPLVLVYILVISRRVSLSTLFPLVLIPMYWAARTASGAVPLSGDYGYNLSKLPVNALGNGIGYVAAIFAGPRVVDTAHSVREVLQPYGSQLMVGMTVLAAVSIALLAKPVVREMRTGTVKSAIHWFVIAGLFMVPYLGLGGMAERYAILPSMALTVGLVLILDFLVSRRYDRWFVITMATVLLLVVWNIRELERVASDWGKASRVAEETLLTVKSEFFPLEYDTHFLIIDVPIRYGRAWIFPTGLGDAFWHMYRFGPYTYTIVPVGSMEEAYAYPVASGQRYELIFEDYVLKRAVKQVETIELEPPGGEPQ